MSVHEGSMNVHVLVKLECALCMPVLLKETIAFGWGSLCGWSCQCPVLLCVNLYPLGCVLSFTTGLTCKRESISLVLQGRQCPPAAMQD